MTIRERIKPVLKIIGVVLLMAFVFGYPLLPVINEQISIENTTYGVVTSFEEFPKNKFNFQALPRIWVHLESDRTIILNQTLPFNLSIGQRLRITTWKRRLFGYSTMYEPA